MGNFFESLVVVIEGSRGIEFCEGVVGDGWKYFLVEDLFCC